MTPSAPAIFAQLDGGSRAEQVAARGDGELAPVRRDCRGGDPRRGDLEARPAARRRAAATGAAKAPRKAGPRRPRRPMAGLDAACEQVDLGRYGHAAAAARDEVFGAAIRASPMSRSRCFASRSRQRRSGLLSKTSSRAAAAWPAGETTASGRAASVWPWAAGIAALLSGRFPASSSCARALFCIYFVKFRLLCRRRRRGDAERGPRAPRIAEPLASRPAG